MAVRMHLPRREAVIGAVATLAIVAFIIVGGIVMAISDPKVPTLLLSPATGFGLILVGMVIMLMRSLPKG